MFHVLKGDQMRVRKIDSAEDVPIEMRLFKRQHFQEIFGVHWESVLDRSLLMATNEGLLVCEIDGVLAGWVQYHCDTYFVGFRNFAVLPAFRGRGVARRLLTELRDIATGHHHGLIANGEKPDDVRLMYLKSMVYMDSDTEGEAFAFDTEDLYSHIVLSVHDRG